MGSFKDVCNLDQSEFVIVYGRRRIGKTFLIEQFFNKKYDFKFVGGHKLSSKAQLANFAKALRKYAKVKINELNSWSGAFDAFENMFIIYEVRKGNFLISLWRTLKISEISSR